MMSLFTGLSAFPLTPLVDDRIDTEAFIQIIRRLAATGVDSITAMGSTGSYPYLSMDERARVTELAVEHADDIPVFVGIGALRTSDVLRNVASAEKSGAAGLLLAPVSYQPLTDEDVFNLFRTVTEQSAIPVILYDNQRTTHFQFSLDLYARIAQLPGVASIKISGIPGSQDEVTAHVSRIREVLPSDVTLGVANDPYVATSLIAGCDAWYSVIGGTLPELAIPMMRAAQRGDAEGVMAASDHLAPLLECFISYGGGLRVIAAVAEHLGFATRSCLPLPILGLNDEERAHVDAALQQIGVERMND